LAEASYHNFPKSRLAVEDEVSTKSCWNWRGQVGGACAKATKIIAIPKRATFIIVRKIYMIGIFIKCNKYKHPSIIQSNFIKSSNKKNKNTT
jgi:hypothetical protein